MKLKPLIIFVPGLRPKPEPEKYIVEIVRCLVEGIKRIDSAVAADLDTHSDCVELIGWSFPFYGIYHDIELDKPGIEALLQRQFPARSDQCEAVSWQRRLLRTVYGLADRLPFQVPPIGNAKLEMHLQDLQRYVRNVHGIADQTRSLLHKSLRNAATQGRPILLVGHSMGSVIAFDALWELSHETGKPCPLDTLLTLGSPLGQQLIRRRLLGHDREGAGRYPTNIRHWVNIAAVGELTAIHMQFAESFSEMKTSGLVDSIEDHLVYNHFREGGTGGNLNVHSEYGYLFNEVTAGVVAHWWASQRGLLPPAN